MRLETERLPIKSPEVFGVEPYSRIVAEPESMRFLTGRAESCDEARQYTEERAAGERDRDCSGLYPALEKRSATDRILRVLVDQLRHRFQLAENRGSTPIL
jgi:hypothetical protein